jgi:phosphoribosylformimino-5-aminoimidazole carboxamide ribonucleotide (ProFAR) isomerase
VFGLLDRFGRHPLIHVIDLDAAMRRKQRQAVRALALPRKNADARRVGGGIRTVAPPRNTGWARKSYCWQRRVKVGAWTEIF